MMYPLTLVPLIVTLSCMLLTASVTMVALQFLPKPRTALKPLSTQVEVRRPLAVTLSGFRF